MLYKNVIVFEVGFVFCVVTLDKFFSIANRANNKIAVADFAAAGGIIALAITICGASVVSDFAFDRL